jgi:hypothetical protein
MRIERWLGFRVHKARRPKNGYQAVDVRLTQNRPTGLAVKFTIEIDDDLIEPRIELVAAEPGELVGSIEIEEEE